MLGAIAGDIIGSTYEWEKTDDRYFDMCRSVKQHTGRKTVSIHPHFTDETVMTLAVAKWLQQDSARNSSKLIEMMQSMGRDYIDCGFSPQMKRWLESDDPRPSNNYGNSAAARISPIGLTTESLYDAIHLARQATMVTHSHPDGIKGAEAMTQAIWMARHGRSKEDIRFAMEHDFGYDLSLPTEIISYMAQGYNVSFQDAECEGASCYNIEWTGRTETSCQNTIPASLKAFLDSDGFEDAVRRAVTMCGKSDTIASMTGAIAHAFYGDVPEKINGMCSKYLDTLLKERMQSFETVMIQKKTQTGRSRRHADDSFHIVRMSGRDPLYVVPSYKKEIIGALREEYGDNIIIIKPSDEAAYIRENYKIQMQGTYLEDPRPDIRTIYFKDGKFYSPSNYPGENMADLSIRQSHKAEFLQIQEHAKEVKRSLQELTGYRGEGSIHYENAYYPEIFIDKVEVWRGDMFAGGVGIDPNSGLLKIYQTEELGLNALEGARTENVFNSLSIDSIKESLGRYCLDEGIGIFDKDRTLNIDTANQDIVNSEDKALSKAISETERNSQQVTMKR